MEKAKRPSQTHTASFSGGIKAWSSEDSHGVQEHEVEGLLPGMDLNPSLSLRAFLLFDFQYRFQNQKKNILNIKYLLCETWQDTFERETCM